MAATIDATKTAPADMSFIIPAFLFSRGETRSTNISIAVLNISVQMTNPIANNTIHHSVADKFNKIDKTTTQIAAKQCIHILC